MSYSLTISRGFPWADGAPNTPILLEEWTALVASNEELSPSLEARGYNPKTGEEIVVKTPNSALLRGGEVLSWSDGYISMQHVDELILDYCVIAKALDAEVYGEEGEKY